MSKSCLINLLHVHGNYEKAKIDGVGAKLGGVVNGEERTKERVGEGIRGGLSDIGSERKKRVTNKLCSYEKVKGVGGMASEAPSSEKVAFEQGRKSFNLRVGTIYSDAARITVSPQINQS